MLREQLLFDQRRRAYQNQRLSDLDLHLNSLHDSFAQSLAADLQDVAIRQSETMQQYRPINDAAERLILRSPINGVVFNQRINTIGEVVGPAELRFSAFSHRSSPYVPGRISYVSPDRISNPTASSQLEKILKLAWKPFNILPVYSQTKSSPDWPCHNACHSVR